MCRKKTFGALAGFMFIAFSIALPSMSFAQVGTWTTKANMPTRRCWFSTSEVNGKIYAIGGLRGFLSAVEEYDPATDTWTKKANMPTGRAYLSTSVVNGKIYAIGGSTGGPQGDSNAVEQYNPATDTWTKKADIPTGGVYLATSVVNGKIYAIGGRRYSRVVEEYDPATDTWTRKADMPTARGGLSTSVVNGKIYAIGGWSYEYATNESTAFSAVEEYNPTTDTWTEKADMPMPRLDHAAVVVNDKIYVIGGEGRLTETPVTVGTEDSLILSTIVKYDPATDTWTEEGDMRAPRTALCASVVAGRIYVIGGWEVGAQPVSTVEAYQAVPWGFARDPIPADGAMHLDTWVTLDWRAGDFAVSHDVYMGDNFDQVSEVKPDSDVFRGNQIATFYVAGLLGYDYPDGLVPGSTYYWRIDEVNDADPNSPWKGPIWSFTIAPRKAYDPFPADGAELVDLYVELSWKAGLGAALHAVYFGDNLDEVKNATGGLKQVEITYVPGPLEFAKTYYWRVDELGGARGGETHKGDIWNFTTPGAVGNPHPAYSVTDVAMNTILTWTPADSAVSHQLYFGSDEEAVRYADTGAPEYKGSITLGAESYDPGLLDADTTYFWRVDEVDTHGNVSSGPLWIFTTGSFLLVDDFEGYTDNDKDGEAIWQIWIDGFGVSDNGAQVGNLLPPYCEQTIVHGGAQSMPLLYVNEASVPNSEAALTLTAPRDWTVAGVGELSLWTHGDAANAADPLYVAISNATGAPVIVAHDEPDVAKDTLWTQWQISLQAFADQGINLTDVDEIAIGLGSKSGMVSAGGSGKMYIDDIRLYRPVP